MIIIGGDAGWALSQLENQLPRSRLIVLLEHEVQLLKFLMFILSDPKTEHFIVFVGTCKTVLLVHVYALHLKKTTLIKWFYSKPDVLSSAMRDLTLSVEGVEQTLVAVSRDFDSKSVELNSSIIACPEQVSGRVDRKLTQVCALIPPF